MEGWLASRAIDDHRRNSRLLKKALRLRTADDAEIALAVNGATITDRYWFQRQGENLKYDEIRFKENYFSELALRGDPDSFANKPSRTPELTNIGSFEKCWKLLSGEWWMLREMDLPIITEDIITACLWEIPAELLEQIDTEYVKHFVLNGQERVRKLIY